MAKIVSARIVGIRSAENTSSLADVGADPTRYSMAVFYDDGRAEFKEGDARTMAAYLPYLSRDQDEVLSQVADMLKKHEETIRSMINKEVLKLVDIMKPIPDVRGMEQEQAIELLKAKDFTVNLVHQYPESHGGGRVYAAVRRADAPMAVDLDVRHDMPNVIGMPEDKAAACLEKAGFVVHTVHQYSHEYMGRVAVKQEQDAAVPMEVKLTVNTHVPNVIGLAAADAIQLLKREGVSCKEDYVIADDVPQGIVLSYDQGPDDALVIAVSNGGRIMTAQSIDMSWNELPDTNGDEWAATAYYDRKSKIVSIKFGLQSGSKKRFVMQHVMHVDYEGHLDEILQMNVSGPDLEINEGEIKRMEVRITDQKEQALIQDVHAAIVVTYGLMKKEHCIDLYLTIKW